ncbi:ABC-ATPase domain-containing protein [Corynebacterium sp. sy039]|uniref:ABC-ATPase domain-containing protein n=1 Tax=Corynebacterium sp. sy039 TaxID=2599641 RepID=UPI0011B5DD4E|nr:ABC-ATPase domain-containing protein [Corynebacterium sp. sy039]QDZ42550.1 hypothetical protein FQV43_04775 [Corynebacterium sp. sy039]
MSIFRDIDGAGFGAYKRLRGRWDIDHDTDLFIDRVQSDPYAAPSLARIRLNLTEAVVDPTVIAELSRCSRPNQHRAAYHAATDFIARRFAREIKKYRFTGNKEHGSIAIDIPGQEVLQRAAVVLTKEYAELRIEVALPARGRRIRGYAAEKLLYETLPDLAQAAVWDMDARELQAHIQLVCDQEDLRSQLAGRGLVAFLGDGSVLPRAAGNSNLPLEGAREFSSPESLRTTIRLASGREVTGMGVPQGISVIIGGGYHGKSTVLRAIERGIYNHIAGDGREWAITCPDACAIRAEDGRSVARTDISPFINNLPSGTDTRHFSTTNASGSTSQAASLMEALEAGADCLLIDEDTSATNFMIRDQRMRSIVPAHKEPITPFIDRIRALYTDCGVSTVLVAGGSGDFFDVADHVIMMDSYEPQDVTEQAQGLEPTLRAQPAVTQPSTSQPTPTQPADTQPVAAAQTFELPAARRLRQGGLAKSEKFGKHGAKPPKAQSRDSIILGRSVIDLSAVAQLVDRSQTQAIARIIGVLKDRDDDTTPLVEQVSELIMRAQQEGMDSLSGGERRGGHGTTHPGHLALPRVLEVMAAINRYRELDVR